MDFQRARSDEQRNERRRAILDTTARMLLEMPVADISLNELSRQVGLAKSNVLRYFESREAILLELLDGELRNWVTELDRELVPAQASIDARVDELADRIADTLAARPELCDLVAAQAAVLERNISTDVAVRYKRATAANVDVLVAAIVRSIPELDATAAYQVVAHALLMASAAWPHSQPTDALRCAYESDPELAQTQMRFVDVVRDTVQFAAIALIERSGRP